MSSRKPGDEDGPKAARRRWRPSRGTAASAALIAVFGVVMPVVLATDRSATPRAQAAAAAAAVPPGVRPDVQGWFKRREKLQIELNDALVPFVQNRAGAAECRRLNAAARAMLGLSRAPDLKIDALARAGLDKFAQGATACLAGNMAESQRLVHEGLAERADATLPLDEALEGE